MEKHQFNFQPSISQNRFDLIRARFRCGPSDDAALAENEWCFFENIVDSFNAHVPQQITAGWLLAPDESMGAWRGQVGKRDTKKCPHRMFVQRKPEPLGVVFKNIGDALSGVILAMEITKGKAEVVKPKFYNKDNGATAATTLRLAEPHALARTASSPPIRGLPRCARWSSWRLTASTSSGM